MIDDIKYPTDQYLIKFFFCCLPISKIFIV